MYNRYLYHRYIIFQINGNRFMNSDETIINYQKKMGLLASQ